MGLKKIKYTEFCWNSFIESTARKKQSISIEKVKKISFFKLLQNETQRTYPGYALSANPRLKISVRLKTKPWIETRQPWGNEHQDISYTLLCASYFLLWVDSLSETTKILFFQFSYQMKTRSFSTVYVNEKKYLIIMFEMQLVEFCRW